MEGENVNLYEQLKERETLNNAEIAYWQSQWSDEAMFRVQELQSANERLHELMREYEHENQDNRRG